MAAIVKMWTNPSSVVPKYVTMELAEGVTVRPTTNLHGTSFSNALFYSKGEVVEELKAGQHFTVTVGQVQTDGYNGLFQPNHKLYSLCSNLLAVAVLEPNETTLLTISGSARIAFRPADLDYVARLYLVD